MEEKYNQYLQYDFNNSEEYKDFVEKFPLEPNESIEEHHKRFYKSHICRDFDSNYIPPPQSSNMHNNFQRNNNNSNRVNHYQNNNNMPPLLEIIDFGSIGLFIINDFIIINQLLFI